MSKLREIRKTAKMGANKAIRKAKGFVLFTYDYDGRLHMEAETSAMVKETDIFQLAIKTAESYLRNLSLAAISRSEQQRGTVEQSRRVIETKKQREKALSSFLEGTR